MSDRVSDDVEFAAYSNGEKKQGSLQDGEQYERRRRASIAQGQVKHSKLGWKRLTVRDCHFHSLIIPEYKSSTTKDIG